jgi:threonine dehydrogenase-like Zn-dependent dehydrogenase
MMAKEIIFSGKARAELQSCELSPLGEADVRGRTVVSLISPGTELAWLNDGNYPLRPGYAAVFEAEELGSSVRGIVKGELLLCMGGHRSIQQFDQKYTVKVPSSLSAEHAVIARLMGVSMTTLMTTAARPGDKVLICGAGPVGYLAAHQFSISGYGVTVIEPDITRQAQVKKSGLQKVLSAIPLGDGVYDGEVALVVDCSGHERAVLDGCKVVRKKGEVVLVGVPWKAHTQILAHEILNAIFFKFAVVRSGWEWEVPIRGRDFVWEELYQGYNNAPHSTMSGLKLALDWLAAGKIPLAGLVTTRKVVDPQTIYDALMAKKIAEPFVVLDWAG